MNDVFDRVLELNAEALDIALMMNGLLRLLESPNEDGFGLSARLMLGTLQEKLNSSATRADLIVTNFQRAIEAGCSK